MKLVATEEQTALAEMARSWADAEGPVAHLRALREQHDELAWDRARYASMAELGWPAILIPEEHGGLDLGMAELAVVLEALGRNLTPSPLHSATLLGGTGLTLAGSPVQQAHWLPRIAEGDAIVTLAWSEHHHFDPNHFSTRATRSGQRWTLTGTKRHVADGHGADGWIVSARTEGGPALFLVEPGPGVATTRTWRVDGRNVATLQLDRATAERLPGADGVLRRLLDTATIGLCAEMLGSADGAFAMTLAYLHEREQFGVKIGSFQALQHRAVRLFVKIELARSAVLAATRLGDTDADTLSRYASLAKVRTSDAFVKVAEEAVQMHGGIGMTDECDVGFYLKRAQTTSALLGDPGWHRRRWARLGGY